MNEHKIEFKRKAGKEALFVTECGESAASKSTLIDLLLNSPLSGSGLEIIRDQDDFAGRRCIPVNFWE